MNPLTLPKYQTSTDIVHETSRQPLTSPLTTLTPAHPFLTSESGSTFAQAFASQLYLYLPERQVLLPPCYQQISVQRSGGRISVLVFFCIREKERTEAAFAFPCTPPTQFNIKGFYFYSSF